MPCSGKTRRKATANQELPPGDEAQMLPGKRQKCNKKRDRSNIGPDGLTKDQRFYHKKKRALAGCAADPGLPALTPRPAASGEMNKTIANLQSVISTVAPSWDPAFARTSWEKERFHEIIIGINRWMSVWGGVDNWNSGLLAAYEEAVEVGEQEVEHFYDMVWSHANRGRVFQAQLGEMRGNLPPEHYRVKELYYLEVRATIALTKGITIIEIRVPLLSDYLSIRHQVEQQRRLEMAQLPPSDPPSDSEDSLSEHS